MTRSTILTAVPVLLGLAIMALGLNIGLGGIRTLGWQSAVDFVTVTDAAVFAVQDSHIRFIGGIWFCVGALFCAGAFMREALRDTLVVLCGAIAVAGLFRLSGEVVYDAAILPSLVLELVAFPFLGWVLARAGRWSA